jgi:hypothetical protein
MTTPVKTEKFPPSAKSSSLRAYLAYRHAQLAFEGREIAATSSAGLSGGYNLINRGERLRVIELMLAELDALATWLDNGEPEFIPPLTEADKTQWRWARDHGMAVPPHIEEQL